jgi:hypothetical protein
VITKVTHGWRPGGLVAYLMGPGTTEAHVRPRVIASWDGLDAGWQPDFGPRDEFDFRLGPLIGALHVPATRAGLPVSGKGQSGRGYVWHCSVRLGPEDRTLADAEWAGIARRLLDGAGIATTDDDGGPRWIAVRHADDHIHIAAVLVREDTGRRFWPHHDYRGLRRIARELEAELGLTRTAAADRTATRRPQRAELEIAVRQGVEPARTELARVARQVATAATTPEEFVDELRGRGYLVELRRLPSGDLIGYKIARNAVEPVWFSGGKLATDLSMPKLIARWALSAERPDIPTSQARTALCQTRESLVRAKDVVRGSRHNHATENTDGIAHAVADVITAVSVATGGALDAAADRYDRAARAPFRPVPPVGPAGLELRSLARQLIRAGRITGKSDALALLGVLVALAAVVHEIAAWRSAQGRIHQCPAASDTAALIRHQADKLRSTRPENRSRRKEATVRPGLDRPAGHARTPVPSQRRACRGVCRRGCLRGISRRPRLQQRERQPAPAG